MVLTVVLLAFHLDDKNIPEIAFRLVQVFYGSNVVLWVLSVFRWKADKAD